MQNCFGILLARTMKDNFLLNLNFPTKLKATNRFRLCRIMVTLRLLYAELRIQVFSKIITYHTYCIHFKWMLLTHVLHSILTTFWRIANSIINYIASSIFPVTHHISWFSPHFNFFTCTKILRCSKKSFCQFSLRRLFRYENHILVSTVSSEFSLGTCIICILCFAFCYAKLCLSGRNENILPTFPFDRQAFGARYYRWFLITYSRALLSSRMVYARSLNWSTVFH